MLPSLQDVHFPPDMPFKWRCFFTSAYAFVSMLVVVAFFRGGAFKLSSLRDRVRLFDMGSKGGWFGCLG